MEKDNLILFINNIVKAIHEDSFFACLKIVNKNLVIIKHFIYKTFNICYNCFIK
jgi:hypothetical protein